MKQYTINISIILFLFTVQLRAQTSDIQFYNYSNEDGLLSNFVEDIVQDKDGFLWFATDKGICRYDGSHFVAYNSEKDYLSGQPQERLYTLFVDKDNNLWTGSLPSGLSRYDRNNDVFVNYGINDTTGKSNRVYDIFQDSKEQILIGTGDGIYKFDDDADTLIKVISMARVIKLAELNGRLWASVDNHGVYVYDIESYDLVDKYAYNEDDNTTLPGNTVRDLQIDNNGDFWVATDNCGFAKFNQKTKQFERLTVTVNGKPLVGSFSDILFATNGTTYLSGDNLGLVCLLDNNPTAIQYKSDIYTPMGLKANTVTGMIEDQSQSVWLSTYAGGLFRFSTNSQSIIQYRAGHLDGNNLSHPFVSSFAEDAENNVWIGLDGGGVNILNRKTGKVSYLNEISNDLSVTSVVDLDVDKYGTIWLANWRLGYGSFYNTNGTYKYKAFKYPVSDLDYYDNHKSILIDSKNRIWTANHFKAPSIYHLDENKLYTRENPGHYPVSLFETERTVSYFEDSFSNIWVLTYSGLFKFDEKHNTFSSYRSSNPELPFGSSEMMIDICEDANNNIWIATNASVVLYLSKEDSFINYTEKLGIPPARSLLSNNNDLWLTTNEGVIKFNIISETIDVFDDGYTMLGNTFSERAAYKASDGFLYFGGKDGFIMFHPDSIHNNLYPPTVYITDIEINGELQKPLDENSVLEKQAYLTDEIVLEPDHHMLSLNFAALNYINSEKNTYEVMLEGLDKNWRTVRNEPYVTYTNLSPGKYTFKVKAANNDGVWSTEEAILNITVLPPFNKTFWFRALMLLLVVFLTYVLYRYKVNSITKRREWLEEEVNCRTLELNMQKEEAVAQRDLILWQKTELEKHQNHLEELVKERTHDLEEAKNRAEKSDLLKTAFLQNLSHEIRTPLNAIMGFSNVLYDPTVTEEEAETSKQIITRSSNNLLSIIDDIIFASLIESDQLNVNSSPKDVIPVLRELETEYKQVLSEENGHVSIAFENNIAELSLCIDHNHFERTMRHLLQNAIKFSDKGVVSYGFKLSGSEVVFYVKDMGCGIRKEDQVHIFERFMKFDSGNEQFKSGTGLGLSFSKWFVEQHNGKMWVESKEQEGSTFYFTLPLADFDEKLSPVNEGRGKTGDEKNNVYKSLFKNKTILVAEDDESNYRYLYFLLKKTAAKIIRAENGREAVDLFKENTCDIILMDLKMPVMDGFEALDEIRSISKNIPVIAQTAYVHHESVDALLDRGFDAYIYKPLKQETLIELVSEYIG